MGRRLHSAWRHEKPLVGARRARSARGAKAGFSRSPVEMPDGYTTRPAEVRVIDGPWNNVTTLEFVLKEGRKRQIRRLCSAAHLVVISLKRVAIGRLRLPPEMKPGEWRDLTEAEIAAAKEGS